MLRVLMRLQLIRSATLRLRFGGQTFLIDPWFARRGEGLSYAGERPSPLCDLPLPLPDILDGVDAVIVSHLHSDHFDDAARSVLPRQVPVLCAARDASAIRQFGFKRVTGIETELEFGGVHIRLTAGRHGPDEVLPEMGEASGFLFRAADEPVLYWAGDTIFCEEVRDVILDAHPKVIVVHACGAEWKGYGPLVMDEQMTESVLRLAHGANVVATHLDSVDHATSSRESLKAYFARVPEVASRLCIPDDGETIALPEKA